MPQECRRPILERAFTARTVNAASMLLLVLLFCASLNSLSTFPDSYEDEGCYAEAGYSLATRGVFTPYGLPSTPAMKAGDGLRPRLPSLVFGHLGGYFGYSLTAARTISFVLAWCAVGLWLPIAKSFGVPPALGALLLAASERVFWASHVFRPEATLVLVNSLLLLVVVRTWGRRPRATTWLGRGLLSGALVLAHGNGLVSAVLNTVETLVDRVRGAWRERAVRAGAYAAGAIVAIAAFYLVQVRPIGGWHAFAEQLAAAAQYQPRSGILASLRSELVERWGRELVFVGASVAAKVMRMIWYAIVWALAVRAVVASSGLPRRLGLMSLGTVLGYALLVHDRVDIHIAEMIPFFLAPVLAWIGTATSERPRSRRLAVAAAVTLLGIGLALCFHHAIKYRPQVHTPTPVLRAAAIRDYVTNTPAGPNGWTVVGSQDLWFWLRDVVPIMTRNRANEKFGPSGDIVVALDLRRMPWLRRCQAVFRDPTGYFRAYRCPRPPQPLPPTRLGFS